MIDELELRGAARDAEAEALRIYLRAIARHPLLTPDRERELFKQRDDARAELAALERAHVDDERTRAARRGLKNVTDKLVTSNLRLAVSLAKRYRHRGLPFLDLIQEANAGLVRAVEAFELQKGFRVSTYAAWWMTHHVLRAIEERSRTIRLPVHVQASARRMRRLSECYETAFGELPELDALAQGARLTPGAAANALEASRLNAIASLDARRGEDGGATLHELVAAGVETPEAAALRAERERMARVLLGELPERTRLILEARMGEAEPTLANLGEGFNVSRERVRQLERDGLQRLRTLAARRGLQP